MLDGPMMRIPLLRALDDHGVDVEVGAVDRRHDDRAADVGGDAVVDRLVERLGGHGDDSQRDDRRGCR